MNLYRIICTKFSANDDVKAKNTTLKDTWAHYIRIYPKSRTGKWMCMRIALYGCPSGEMKLWLSWKIISFSIQIETNRLAYSLH